MHRSLLDKIKDSVYNNSNINNNNGKKNYEYDIKQNYKSNKGKNYYEKMEETKKKSTKKEYDIKNENSTDNLNTKNSISADTKWQKFLNVQIGERGKGKTVQELKLPTKETINNKKTEVYNVLYQSEGQTNTMNLPV